MVLEISAMLRPYGLRLSSSSVGGSVASARDANVSMMRFTQSIWIAFRGVSCITHTHLRDLSAYDPCDPWPPLPMMARVPCEPCSTWSMWSVTHVTYVTLVIRDPWPRTLKISRVPFSQLSFQFVVSSFISLPESDHEGLKSIKRNIKYTEPENDDSITMGWTWWDWSLILRTLSSFSHLKLLVGSFDP